MKKLNVAIIGLGKIGLGYDLASENGVRSHTKAILGNRHTKLILGIDPNYEARSLFEDISKSASYTSLEEVPDGISTQIDILVMSTPSHSRVLDLNMLLKKFSKINFLILEKPVALTLSESQELRALLEKKHLTNKVLVNYIRRCNPFFVKLRNRIQSNEFGEIKKINLLYSDALINMGSHFIDLVNYFFSFNFKVISKSNFVPLAHQDFLADAELVSSEIKFSIQASNENKFELTMVFEKLNVQILNSGSRIIVDDEEIFVDLSRYQEDVVNHLIDAIKNKTPILSDFDSAEKALEICENIRRF